MLGCWVFTESYPYLLSPVLRTLFFREVCKTLCFLKLRVKGITQGSRRLPVFVEGEKRFACCCSDCLVLLPPHCQHFLSSGIHSLMGLGGKKKVFSFSGEIKKQHSLKEKVNSDLPMGRKVGWSILETSFSCVSMFSPYYFSPHTRGKNSTDPNH